MKWSNTSRFNFGQNLRLTTLNLQNRALNPWHFTKLSTPHVLFKCRFILNGFSDFIPRGAFTTVRHICDGAVRRSSWGFYLLTIFVKKLRRCFTGYLLSMSDTCFLRSLGFKGRDANDLINVAKIVKRHFLS